jgi:hypothetical protein
MHRLFCCCKFNMISDVTEVIFLIEVAKRSKLNPSDLYRNTTIIFRPIVLLLMVVRRIARKI